ncbi:hypothetical protein Peetri_00035 [Pseudomonas phage vB_PpuM-Peetri]
MNTFESFAFMEGGADELAKLINQEIAECRDSGADDGSFAIHNSGRYQVQIRITREADDKLDVLMSGVAVPTSEEEDDEDDLDEDDDDADNEEELAAFIKDDEDREEREEEEAFDREVHDEIMAGQDSRNVEDLSKLLMGLSMLGLVTLRIHLVKVAGTQNTAGFFTLMGKEDRVDNLLDNYTSEQITAALEAVGLTKPHPDRDVEELFGETDDLAAGIQSEEELERLEEAQLKDFPSSEGYNKEKTEIADMLSNKSGSALNLIHRGLKTMSLDESPFDPMTKVKRIRAILAYPVGHIRAVIRSCNLDTKPEEEDEDSAETRERKSQLENQSRENLILILERIETDEGQCGLVTTAATPRSTLINHLVDYYAHAQIVYAAKALGLKLGSANAEGKEL